MLELVQGILEGIFVAHDMHDAAGLVARFARQDLPARDAHLHNRLTHPPRSVEGDPERSVGTHTGDAIGLDERVGTGEGSTKPADNVIRILSA